MKKDQLQPDTYYTNKLRQRIKLLYITDNKIVILKQNGEAREIFSPLFIEWLKLDKNQTDDYIAIDTKELLQDVYNELKDKTL